MSVGRSLFVTGIHLGPGGNVRTFKQTTLNNGGSGPWLGQLGQIFEQDGCFFRLVQWTKGVGSVDAIDGGVAYWKDKSSGVYKVTCDASDGEALANGIAGGTQVVMTSATDDLSYIFIQVGGDQKAVVIAASAVAGDHATGHASTDNVLTRTAAGTAPPDRQAGIVLTTRGSTTSDNGASVANSSKIRWILGSNI